MACSSCSCRSNLHERHAELACTQFVSCFNHLLTHLLQILSCRDYKLFWSWFCRAFQNELQHFHPGHLHLRSHHAAAVGTCGRCTGNPLAVAATGGVHTRLSCGQHVHFRASVRNIEVADNVRVCSCGDTQQVCGVESASGKDNGQRWQGQLWHQLFKWYLAAAPSIIHKQVP